MKILFYYNKYNLAIYNINLLPPNNYDLITRCEVLIKIEEFVVKIVPLKGLIYNLRC